MWCVGETSPEFWIREVWGEDRNRTLPFLSTLLHCYSWSSGGKRFSNQMTTLYWKKSIGLKSLLSHPDIPPYSLVWPWLAEGLSAKTPVVLTTFTKKIQMTWKLYTDISIMDKQATEIVLLVEFLWILCGWSLFFVVIGLKVLRETYCKSVSLLFYYIRRGSF